MLQSNTFGLVLIVGLAGICQVATFGTMPGNWKDLSVSARGESGSPENDDIVRDPDFCINLPSMRRTAPATYAGTQWCSSVTTEKECGYGTTLYRLSSAGLNKYDPCWWDKEARNGAGKCKMTKDTYVCGDQCFPTAQDTSTDTTDDGTTYIECGGLREEVDVLTGVETSCDCVKIYEDGEIKMRCAISKKQIVSTRRRLDERRRLSFAEECSGLSTILSTTSGPGNLETKQIYECVPTVNVDGDDECKCNTKSVLTMPETDIPEDKQMTNEELYQNDNVAEDASCQANVSPYYWG